MKWNSHGLYCTVAEASNLLGMSRGKVYRLISRGFLLATRVGPRLLRIPEAELERFVTERDEFFAHYFSRAEAGRRLRVSDQTISKWIWKGWFSPYKFATFPMGVPKEEVWALDPGARNAA